MKAPEETANPMHGTKGKPCLDCHNPHESASRNLMRDDSVALQCAECHADFLAASESRPFRHKHFDSRGRCGDCHYAHQRGEEKYLRENVGETCLTCHDLGIQVDKRGLENVAVSIRDSLALHGPLKKGQESCPVCHTPHGADQPSLLRDGYPAGKYQSYSAEQYALCWRCHSKGLVEAEDGEGATGFRQDSRNLHRVHVAELKRGRSCGLCHSPHAGNGAHLLKDSIRFDSWTAPLIYSALPDGGSCQTPCHRPKEYRRGGPASRPTAAEGR